MIYIDGHRTRGVNNKNLIYKLYILLRTFKLNLKSQMSNILIFFIIFLLCLAGDI